MCGRCTLTVEFSVIIEEFNLKVTTPLDYKPSYNIAPSQTMPIIVQENTERQALTMNWGLQTSYTAQPIINARSETIAQKRTFKTAFQQKRCLIPADGFFEWKQIANHKQPYYFYLPNHRLFAFAGIYQSNNMQNESSRQFCILTTAANTFIRPYHHRMPVIFSQPQQYELWLNPDAEPQHLLEMLSPSQEMLNSHPVAKAVNQVKNNTPACIEPYISTKKQLDIWQK